MVFGDKTTYSPGTSQADTSMGVPSSGSVCGAAAMHQHSDRKYLNDGDPSKRHRRREIQPGADLTKSVIERRNLYVKEHYPSWPADLTRIALGVVLMSATRDITA